MSILLILVHPIWMEVFVRIVRILSLLCCCQHSSPLRVEWRLHDDLASICLSEIHISYKFFICFIAFLLGVCLARQRGPSNDMGSMGPYHVSAWSNLLLLRIFVHSCLSLISLEAPFLGLRLFFQGFKPVGVGQYSSKSVSLTVHTLFSGLIGICFPSLFE